MIKNIKKIKYLANKTRSAYKKEGIKPTLRRISQYIKIRGAVKGIVGNDKNFDFVTNHNPDIKNNYQKSLTKNAKDIILHWIIPDFAIGAGGHMTIFRIIRELEKHNIINNIYIHGPLIHRKKSEQFRQTINKHFLSLKANIYIGTKSLEDHLPDPVNQSKSDLQKNAVIATSWETAYEAKKFTSNLVEGFYFVQDYEPNFYALGSQYIFAENTYKLGLHGITAGPWLTELLNKKYNMQSDYFDLAFDKNIYSNCIDGENYKKSLSTNRNSKKFKICFYARPVTPRRAFELGIQSLKLALDKDKNLEIHFFGADTSFYDVPFNYTNHGVLSAHQLSGLYSRMDLGMVFSLTNHSLIPKEMMACKLPVLDLNLDSNNHIFSNNKNIFLANPDPFSIAEKIYNIKKNPQNRKKVINNAVKYVKDFSWQKSGEMVLDIIKNSL